MSQSRVCFTDFRVLNGDTIQKKLERLIKAAGFDEIDFDGKFVAIKLHFGEPGNLAFLRPNYAKTVADMVRARGGKPFLTDCNTLYVGGRKNALDHIDSAYINGFSPFSTGCHIIIADGLKGTDDVAVPVAGGEYVKNAMIGRAIMDADIVISLNHFKGHEATGFGGALKNLGMGCGSRAGKMDMHCDGKPYVDARRCIGCGACVRVCAHDAVKVDKTKHIAAIDVKKCVGCGRCIGVCPKDATNPGNDSANDILDRKIAEYTKAVVDGRPNFHINIITDVSPLCDCHSDNDAPIVPNVGMLASFDPVAIDVASADAVNAQTPVRASALGDAVASSSGIGGGRGEHDHFDTVNPDTAWRVTTDHAQKIGVGNTEYELVKVR